MRKNKKGTRKKIQLLFFIGSALCFGMEAHAQQYTGIFKTVTGNTDYHHLTRDNANGAAVYINQVGSGPVLRLSSGTATANQNVNFTVENNGNVGIGATSPTAKLEIQRSGTIGAKWVPEKSYLTITDGNSSMIVDPNEIYSSGVLHIGSANGDIVKFRTVSDTGVEDKMVVKGSGNVGIGTTTPDAKLTVKGKIHTQEVKVDLAGAVAPDYVFKEEYHLRSLEEVQAHIKEKGHLPGIPSAKEMEEEGINLKEMNLKLLEKVEELTLYTIKLQEEIKVLQQEIRQTDYWKNTNTAIKTNRR
ncbi:tail fiber protein [Sinomicrobium sp. M5D2P9]